MRKRRAIPLLLTLWLAFNLPPLCHGQDEDLAALRKKAEDGDAAAQFNLGMKYAEGEGVEKDAAEAVRWYRRAAEQNHAEGQFNLGWMHANGEGVEQDATEAVRWYRKAAEQDHAQGQLNLGWMYANGQGVEKDYVSAYFYYALAARTDPNAARNRDNLKRKMSPRQIAEAQRLVREWKPQPTPDANQPASREGGTTTGSARSGTGFAVTEDGFIVTSAQVVSNAVQVRVLTSAGIADAIVVRLDSANDVALLKVNARFTPLPVVASRSVRLNQSVATVVFPDIGLQKFAPKLAKGEIAALAGIQDDPRHFQISALVQPGNSGGALVDERGNVIGMIVAQPGPKAALAALDARTGNVNCAVKSTFIIGFLESLPDVVAKLKEPHTAEHKFEDVVKDVEKATVLVLAP